MKTMKIQNFAKKSLKIIDNNKAIVNNYNALYDFDNKKIIIDNYIIYGKNLVIKKIDEISVEIYGEMEKIEINKD